MGLPGVGSQRDQNALLLATVVAFAVHRNQPTRGKELVEFFQRHGWDEATVSLALEDARRLGLTESIEIHGGN